MIVFWILLVPLGARQSGRDVGCSEWRECRRLALAAADLREYERFHDLAWRAVQLGPARDPLLMSLLARAQALSGRPHDALVMLDRLADMGVALDADTNDDFVVTRRLPGWPAVIAHIDRVRQAARPGPTAPIATAPVAAAPAANASATAAPPVAPTPVANIPSPAPLEAIRFSANAFTPAGLAYDAVSQRFLFGDRLARKLFVVSERSQHANDFARAESAGFQEIAAIEIDAKRGDLWVVSVAPAAGTGTLHKLQLVSGRLLRSVRNRGTLCAGLARRCCGHRCRRRPRARCRRKAAARAAPWRDGVRPGAQARGRGTGEPDRRSRGGDCLRRAS